MTDSSLSCDNNLVSTYRCKLLLTIVFIRHQNTIHNKGQQQKRFYLKLSLGYLVSQFSIKQTSALMSPSPTQDQLQRILLFSIILLLGTSLSQLKYNFYIQPSLQLKTNFSEYYCLELLCYKGLIVYPRLPKTTSTYRLRVVLKTNLGVKLLID